VKRVVVTCMMALWLLPGRATAAEVLHVAVRGHDLPLPHVVIAEPRASVLFLPGDGGWRGFALTIANTMAAGGYDVYGLDTRDYLEAFTGTSVLSVAQIGEDLATMTAAIRQHNHRNVILVGWSEGAALVVAAAALNPSSCSGVIAFGMPEQAALAWRLRDSLASLAGREPDEPEFEVGPLLARLQAIPLVMIQATHDPYTAIDRARALFERVPAPKRLQFIEARNHRFDGGTKEFFAALDEGLAWVQAVAGRVAATGRPATRESSQQ
jgi:pimeloyl-ACP methyl ester carboxylesterase